MSDLSMYELEDIIWDDFDRGDDHIVPHPTNDRTRRNSFEGNSCKKPRREPTSVLSNTRNLDASISICQGKAERDSKPLDNNENIMEKESSSSHAPPAIFNVSCDGEIIKDMPNLASDDTRMLNNCFKSSYNTSSSELCVDDRVLSYPLTNISRSEDLCFVENNCKDKESGDLLYYGWPDIGNFEDVDKMLRSCDSSFGLGATDNDDELGWFTSDHIGGAAEDALKMDFRFPCPEPSALKNISPDHDSPDSINQRSCCISESKDELNYKDQVNLQRKQAKHLNQTEGKKAGRHIGNDGSFYQISDIESSDTQLSAINKCDQIFTSIGNRQQYRNLELDCFGHMQSNNSYLPPDYPYQTITDPTLSCIKSEHKGLKSSSSKGSSSSYASNQIHSIENSGDPSFDERKQACSSQGFQSLIIGSPSQMGMMFQSSKGVLVSAEKQAHLSAKEVETQRDVGVQKGISAEILGSLNVPEISSISSELDEISLEATSFRQLRQAMEQLDVRTKLCIRDSLYRLARSAEQRHNNPSLSSGATDINNIGGPLMAEQTNKCAGFMDIETDTNPIDRSVAHLLFHRPSESPNLHAPSPLKPNVNQGCISVPSVMVEKLACEEEAADESNGKIVN